jgi:hypothetical protein
MNAIRTGRAQNAEPLVPEAPQTPSRLSDFATSGRAHPPGVLFSVYPQIHSGGGTNPPTGARNSRR